jgi:hypothetical protein
MMRTVHPYDACRTQPSRIGAAFSVFSASILVVADKEKGRA